jgi:hypothetical protein
MNKSNMIKLSIVSLVAIGTTGTLGYLGLQEVSALTSTGSTYSTIIENIAKKFNLNQSDVQSVFDETRTQARNDRLTQMVTDGKITEAQKALLIVKEAEIEKKIKDINAKQLTATERQTQIKAVNDEMEKWLSDNKISSEVMRGLGGRGGMEGEARGMGMGRMM